MDKDELYQKILKAINNGNDAEIRTRPDGQWVVLEVKRNKIL